MNSIISTNRRFISLVNRVWSGTQGISAKFSQKDIRNTLKARFPKAVDIDVRDISGGCGAMYEILVVSPEFKGVPIVKQHKMISEVLKNEIKDMHGIRIYTSTPDNGDGN